MLFTVTNVENKKVEILRAKFYARQFVLLAKKGATEKLLDKYLIENYNIPLITACLRIIKNAKYQLNYQNEIIVTIPNKKLDEIASIISFGTGKLVGSRILNYAFEKI